MLSRAMDGQNHPSFQPPGLARSGRLERLRMPPEPGLDNAVSSKAFVHSAGDRLYFRQLWHRSIVR
jgi:hypothetical protein